MIIGSHVILYSRDSAADRALLRDVLKLEHVDAGGGWLIFALPPAELAVHPGRSRKQHELYLMCDDIKAFMREMKAHGLECTDVSEQRWGLLTQLNLPGGGKLGAYEPRHARVARKPPRLAAPARPSGNTKVKAKTNARKRPAARARIAARKPAAARPPAAGRTPAAGRRRAQR
jgi:hypothetical protein